MSNNSFVFYRSFWEAMSMLGEKEHFECYKALMNYALEGDSKALDLKDPASRALLWAFRAQIDASARKRQASKAGGAPQGNKNATKKREEPHEYE